jgi:hypothetical protein
MGICEPSARLVSDNLKGVFRACTDLYFLRHDHFLILDGGGASDLLRVSASAYKKAKEYPFSSSIPQSSTAMAFSKQSSPQFNVVEQFYTAVTTWKFDLLESLLSDDYVSKILPASANVPPKNKAEGIQHAKDIGASVNYTPLSVRWHLA